MSKVYFAGSIRGGRNDAAVYKKMIDYIKQKHTVLTEHVGDISYSAFETKDGAKDRQIYNQDTAWLRECDFVIAECSVPSLGVGYELAYAEKYSKPVYILYRKAACELSAMLTGDEYFKIYRYETWDELENILKEII